MKEIRNPDKRLVCCLDEITGSIEIIEKSWLTRIVMNPNGEYEIVHKKRLAA